MSSTGRVSSYTTSRYDLHNRNGSPLCHAVKCRKHKRLHKAHGGMFCAKHLRELQSIRARITHHTPTAESLKREVQARQEESLFRKVMDPGHMHYLLKQENRLTEQSQSVPEEKVRQSRDQQK